MSGTTYMLQPWYSLLRSACAREDQRRVAARLGVSESMVSQALRGSGHYGTGKAKTDRLATRVLHKFGSYPCPHLTEVYGEDRVISADDCRTHAHRAHAPTGSPGQLAHWRACHTCPHKPLSAPAVPKPPRKRKRAEAAVATVSLATIPAEATDITRITAATTEQGLDHEAVPQ